MLIRTLSKGFSADLIDPVQDRVELHWRGGKEGTHHCQILAHRERDHNQSQTTTTNPARLRQRKETAFPSANHLLKPVTRRNPIPRAQGNRSTRKA